MLLSTAARVTRRLHLMSPLLACALGATAPLRAPISATPREERSPVPPRSSRGISAQSWRDPSPHQVRMVTLGSGVQLEVLDWGGAGPPVIFLAGYGNSGHVFDGFAPQFTDHFRVLAITRRGFGASSQPREGYDSPTLAHDILAVLDSLRLGRASLVAHSFGGSELNYLAARFPERVDRLVYLDAAFDFAELYATPDWIGTRAPFPPDPFYDDSSAGAMTLYLARVTGPGYPEAEVRATHRFDARAKYLGGVTPDSLGRVLMRGTLPADFARIRAPALAIYGVPGSAAEKYPFWTSLDSAGRETAERRFEVEARVLADQRARFRRETAGAQVVELAGGRHYIFLTHAPEVAHEMREFLQTPHGRTLPRP